MFVSYFELGLSRDYLVSFKNILQIHILIKYFLINVEINVYRNYKNKIKDMRMAKINSPKMLSGKKYTPIQGQARSCSTPWQGWRGGRSC